MRSTRVALISAATFALALTPAPATAAQPAPAQRTAVGDAPDLTTLPGLGTVATDVAGHAIVVATDLERHRVTYRTRTRAGWWSKAATVPGLTTVMSSHAEVAAGPAGTAVVVAFTRELGGLAVVTRAANGRWSLPYRVSRSTSAIGGFDVAMNADGDIAVAWQARWDHGKFFAAIRQRGGSWQRTLVGGDTTSNDNPNGAVAVGIDARGDVSVARNVRNGRILLRVKPVHGTWRPQRQLSRSAEIASLATMIVEPTGRRSVAYVAYPRTGPWGDGRGVVLHQQRLGGPHHRVWAKSGTGAPGIAAAGGRLRVAWTAEVGVQPPPSSDPEFTTRTRQAYTQLFTVDAHPARTVGAPHTTHYGRFSAATGIDRYGRGAVVLFDYDTGVEAFGIRDSWMSPGPRQGLAQNAACAGGEVAVGPGGNYVVEFLQMAGIYQTLPPRPAETLAFSGGPR